MISSTVFVQEPDYTAFQKTALPVQVLGSVYDALDPYATSLGIVLMVLEKNYAREVFVPRSTRMDNGKTAYMHDMSVARYVSHRNGFEEGQMRLTDSGITDEAKGLVRSFLEMQNGRNRSAKYIIQVCD